MKIKSVVKSVMIISIFAVTSCNNPAKPGQKTENYLNTVLDENFKTVYKIGDSIDYTGLKVIDFNTKEEIKNYTISPEEGTKLTEPNLEYKITINVPNYNELHEYVAVSKDITALDETNREINFYAINDFHGSWNYDTSQNQAGMGKIAYYLKDKKVNEPYSSVVLSAGDMWQGGVESNKTKGKVVTEAMNYIGFDAMAIGNHEFDWAEEAIEANKAMMKFPLLNSNIIYSNYGKNPGLRPTYLEPSTIIDREGIKIGIIGSSSEYLGSDIVESVSRQFIFRAPLEYIKNESDRLRQEGCHLVVLLTHDPGFDGTSGVPTKFADLTKTSEISGKRYLDGIFLGHDHLVKSGEFNGIPFTESGCNGRNVSYVSYKMKKVNGEWVINNYFYNIRSGMNNEIFANSLTAMEDLLEKYRPEIGDVDRVIYNFTKSMSKTDFINIACRAYAYYINNKSEYENKVFAGIQNTGGVRSNVSAGPFTYADLIKVIPFSNTITICKVTKSQYEAIVAANAGVAVRDPNYSSGYEYVATINYVSEKPEYTISEVFDTGVLAQEAIEYYLLNNKGLY